MALVELEYAKLGVPFLPMATKASVLSKRQLPL
jgi:hypothetical protein